MKQYFKEPGIFLNMSASSTSTVFMIFILSSHLLSTDSEGKRVRKFTSGGRMHIRGLNCRGKRRNIEELQRFAPPRKFGKMCYVLAQLL